MALKQGAAALEAAIEKAKSGGTFTETNWLKWEDGETKFLRFLTDIPRLFVLGIHDWYPSHDGKRRTYVCRKEIGETCDICERDAEAKPREMGFGVAVVRLPVREDGKIVGYNDATEEKDGKVVPIVGIVRQAPTNFWIYVQNIENRKGSLRDYDVEIMRKGDDTKTTYMAYDADPKLPIENIDERYAKYTPDVGKMLEYWASRGYYDTFLHGKEKPKEDSSDRSSNQGSQSSAPTEETRREGGEAQGEMTEFERLRAERKRLEEEHAASNGGASSEPATAAASSGVYE